MKRKRTLEQEAARAMRKQLKASRKKFGRHPGPEDPVFFDPKKDVPKPMDEAEMGKLLLDALQKSGAPPEVINAHKKTGRTGMQEHWTTGPKTHSASGRGDRRILQAGG
jgi:hypothetical protein